MRTRKQWMTRWLIVFAGWALLISGSVAAAGDLQFPLRAKYPQLSPIETAELAASYDKVIIVDARNAMEFKVIHMKGAHNFLVGKMQEKNLLSLRPKNNPTPLVFYCNGITCAKSYKAAAKAVKWGFSNVRVYDSGIFYWAQHHPERTLFFGKQQTADTIKTSLISKARQAKKMLAPADFIAKAKGGHYAVFDIRDNNDRKEHPVRLARMKVMTFDTMVRLLEKKSKAVPRSGLLILDNVGKQVKWLHYYLAQEGVSDFYFLKGGVRQWEKDGFDARGNR